MKKIIYLFSFICFALSVNAQSLWNEGMDGSFDVWEEVNGKLLPKGWQNVNTINGISVNVTPTTDRHGNEGKACKISQSAGWLEVDHSWYSWHLSMATTDNNILNIPNGTQFYYTFWAKADVEGHKMYIGATQMYDPNGGGLGWDKMPYVELTTEWKQYGILQTSNYDCKSFSVQLRGNKIFYIDDIALEVGNELPPLNVEEPGPGPEPKPEPGISLWNEGLEGNFDEWVDVNGTLLPKGWYGNTYSMTSNGETKNYSTVLTPAADRYGNEGKACKITKGGDWLDENNWFTWHLAMSTVEKDTNGELNLLDIPKDTEFYYTFWARADKPGLKMYIGLGQMYDPNAGKGGWDNMPYVELTTEWKQYGFLQVSNYDCTSFSVQLRGNKTFYIDDIVLMTGNKLPPLNGIIDVEDINDLEENSLSDIEKIVLTGNYEAEHFEKLKTALGENKKITSITIQETSITNLVTDYFSEINPNCLKYVPAGVTTELPNYIHETTAISEIVLTDNNEFDCGNGILTGSQGISYVRSFINDGGWETILLPFAPDAQGFEKFADYVVEEYVKTENNVIKFSPIDELSKWEANKPYILKSKEQSQEAECILSNRSAGLEIKSTPVNSEFTGVYETESGEGRYFLNETGTEFGLGSSTSTIPPFRAYFSPANQQNMPTKFAVEHSDPTNVSSEKVSSLIYGVKGGVYVNTSVRETITIYSIDGCKVREEVVEVGEHIIDGIQPGIYIVKNQKVLIQ